MRYRYHIACGIERFLYVGGTQTFISTMYGTYDFADNFIKLYVDITLNITSSIEMV